MLKPQQHHTHLFNKPPAVNIAYERIYTYIRYDIIIFILILFTTVQE